MKGRCPEKRAAAFSFRQNTFNHLRKSQVLTAFFITPLPHDRKRCRPAQTHLVGVSVRGGIGIRHTYPECT